VKDLPFLRLFARLFGWSGRRGSIRTQLIVFNIVALALLLGVLGFCTHFFVRTFMLNSIEQQLEDHVQTFADRPPPPGPPRDMPGGMPFGGPMGGMPPGMMGRGPGDPMGGPPQGSPQSPDAGGPGFPMPGGRRDHGGPPDQHRDDAPPFHNGDSREWRGPGPGEAAFAPSPDAPMAPGNGMAPFPAGFGPHHGFHHGGGPFLDAGPDQIYEYNLDGQPTNSRHTHALVDTKAFDQAKQGHDSKRVITTDSEIDYVVTYPRRDRERRVNGVVQGFRSLSEVYDALENLDRALLALIPLGLIGAGMAGAYLTDRVLRRVHALTHVAGLIGARNLSDRLPVTGNDEFSELADTFNGLLARMESAFAEQQRVLEQQRRFTADASHELKTPLTIIKGNTSMALEVEAADTGFRQTLLDIDRAADTMSSLVQDLLLLARSDDGQLGKDRIELLVRELLERAGSGVAHRKGAPITLQIEDDALSVRGNEGELVRLFTNLLENATRYTPAEGRIKVRATRQGNRVLIAVADTGIGIAPEHLPHLGERFYRVDSSRSRPSGGTGLGLSICKSIVEAHGGALSFQSKLNVGTTVTVALPAA
jgi:signal transduction histidine kinase